jgi:very-short-patch-repair endonuclease
MRLDIEYPSYEVWIGRDKDGKHSYDLPDEIYIITPGGSEYIHASELADIMNEYSIGIVLPWMGDYRIKRDDHGKWYTEVRNGAWMRGKASPIEDEFWGMHLKLKIKSLRGLVQEYKIGPYRIDFALPDHKIGIELDGYETHSSTEDIAYDRKRQRYLERKGWHIIRFGGAEIHEHVQGCVMEAATTAQRIMSRQREMNRG